MSLAEVTPASSGEKEVAQLFAEAFELPSVDLEDDFFQLGGDSLIGESLMTAIERRFGVTLSLSILLEAATPRALAREVLNYNKARLHRYMLRVRAKGELPPILCVHGTGGESTAPQTLARITGDRQFVAFRAIGLEQGEPIQTTIEGMASTYLAGAAEVYPSGPVIVLGHCAGAMIAYEMAQQLTAAGRPPSGLILIDPPTDLKKAPWLSKTGLAHSLIRERRRREAAEVDRIAHESGGSISGEERRKLVSQGIGCAAGLYVPKPYEGATVLFYTPDRKEALLDETRGFPSLVCNLEHADIGTDHLDMFDGGLSRIKSTMESFVHRLTT